MEMWFTEKHTNYLTAQVKVRRTLHREKSRYQDIAVLDTDEFGRTLVLDGIIQTTEKDEFIYHEMMAHVPLTAHPDPRRVLVVGGGDGGSVREVLKHPTVESVDLVELDERVIAVCREFLPSLSHSLQDSRVRVNIEDGVHYVKEHEGEYDVIIIDSTDPIGPSIGLFSLPFYSSCERALKDQGMMVAQSEPPFFQPGLVREIFNTVSSVFPVTRLFRATVPVYSCWDWSFTVGSKALEPSGVRSAIPGNTRYWSPEMHAASFVLPPFLLDLLGA